VSGRARGAALGVLVALIAFLPFLRGVVAGACFYFRDLSLYFFPQRAYALERLRAGELAFWNPYLHEGVPLSLPAVGYPLDLLGALSPSPSFLSLLLALHVPLGALLFLALARGLGLRREAACGGAIVYALGGFFLSTLNLYVYLEAAAWAPLVTLAIIRLLSDGSDRRTVAKAALCAGVALSTTGIEIVAQALAAGVVLGLGRRVAPAALVRVAAALGLAAALAAPVLVLVASQVADSARGLGFAPEVVLAHSVHPFALVQTVVGSLFGNPANLANEWWGQNFFPRGFPYVVSLYLGAVALALAVTGLLERRPPAGRLLLLLGGGLVLALGRYGGVLPLVAEAGALRALRFPVKAFFSVHLAVALAAALGLNALAEGRAFRRFASVAGALGAALVGSTLLPLVAPSSMERFAAAFFPPGLSAVARAALLERVLGDAAVGGGLALIAALPALAVLAGRTSALRAAWLVTAVLAVDLLRVGAGLNPMVSSAFYSPSAELAARLPELRAGRVYTCPPDTSRAYLEGRAAHAGEHEAWSFAVMFETLSPAFNVPLRVRTALSPDLTMLVPTDRVLAPEEGSCAELAQLLPRLRAAAVTTVLSLDALGDDELEPLFVSAPERINPLELHAYSLRGALARLELSAPGRVEALSESANRLELAVDAESAARLVVRDAWAAGWRALVDGRPAPLQQARHRVLDLPAGRHRVALSYEPPRLRLAAAAFASALALAAWLARRRG
jgi:hypothetical protein